MGTNYDFHVRKLFKRKSIILLDPMLRKEGYFCSELVAACYKVMGLIDPKKSCTQYWPVTFSSQKKIAWIKDVKLGNEMQMILKNRK